MLNSSSGLKNAVNLNSLSHGIDNSPDSEVLNPLETFCDLSDAPDDRIELQDERVSTDASVADVNSPGIAPTPVRGVADAITDYPPIKYAPRPHTLEASPEVCCIRIKWKEGRSESPSTVKSAGRTLVENYERLSNGYLKFKVSYEDVDVPYKHSARNVDAASKYAKRVADSRKKDGKYRYYVVFTGGASSVSHSGGNTSILLAAGAISHEVGHLIGLGHTGRLEIIPKYKNKPGTDGKNGVELNFKYFTVDGSSDGSSLMSTFASNQLTAAQIYTKGWYQENQVAQHDRHGPANVYKLQTVNGAPEAGRLKAVKIPSDVEGGRSLFLSALRVKTDGKNSSTVPALTMHLANPGSLRILTFSDQPRTVLNNTFEVLEKDGNNFTVKISPAVPTP